MNALTLVVGSALLYLAAYHTYGKFLGRRLFRLTASTACPSKTLADGTDYVATRPSILFGHHFTSIAGTGPIVGPAVAVIWGWVPALVWILAGSVFMGAVHDLGAMVVSLRSQGRSIGDVAADLISPRARLLFLLIIFFLLLIVVAIFGVVIAVVFDMFPQSVLPVWCELPIAVWLGHRVYRKGASHRWASLIAVALMYLTVVVGAYLPIKLSGIGGVGPVGLWVILLLVYAYIASTLPVQTLLQPRDYINSHQLFIALGLLALGVIVARPVMVAPAAQLTVPGAPPVFPMLFVVVACGAVSGFHALVASGTTAKQCDLETSALGIGYGGMLLEGMLAVFVLIACGAGIGMGTPAGGQWLTGTEAFTAHYGSWAAAAGLASKLNAFVVGAGNMIQALGIPPRITLCLMGVFVASFAATTIDTATRLQRYIVSELAIACRLPRLSRKHPATLIAVGSALALAFYNGSGKGALTLWPLFGATNQLLAGLALLVATLYLARRKAPLVYTAVPMLFMLAVTGWAMRINLAGYLEKEQWLLFSLGTATVLLEGWMVAEALLTLRRVYGHGRVRGLPATGS